MQEDIENRTVSMAVSGSKFTGIAVAAAQRIGSDYHGMSNTGEAYYWRTGSSACRRIYPIHNYERIDMKKGLTPFEIRSKAV